MVMCNQIGYRNWIFLTFIVSVSSYNVKLQSDGPIVRGGNMSFAATLYEDDGTLAKGSFKYIWKDTAVPFHEQEHESQSPYDYWSVQYNETQYPAGWYVAQVVVQKYYLLFWAEVASSRLEFYITETLNGHIELIQRNLTRPDIFVSNTDPVIHNVSLKATDAELISQAPTVLTYWFVDCIYYGFRKDLIFPFNYTQADKDHFIEALVVADFAPLPPPPTTTTTTTTTTSTTTTTPKPTTTTKATTTTKPTTKPTTTKPHNTTKVIAKRDVVSASNATSKIMVNVNGTLQPYDGVFPFICNGSRVVTESDKIYGYFSKQIKVKAPVAKVNITGNNWLQHGELLTLNVKCHGSSNLKYCVQYKRGVYNVTGNESCSVSHELEKCEFPIERYFGDSIQYTIMIIIENEISKVVTPVAITVYKVQRQAQLSVIVVPVAFSLVAVVLIVFGVAYYLQNRSRFVVEVADFNFGQNYTDMEYKTFKERVRDSIANAFFSRTPSPGSSEVPVWPPGRKYGSMTS